MYLHGYDVPSGYMGRIFEQYMLFATEEEYREYCKEVWSRWEQRLVERDKEKDSYE